MSFFARLFGSTAPLATTPLAAGVTALERGLFAEALAHFGVALSAAQTGGQRALVHNKCALAHLGRGDREAAVDALCAALLADDRCVPALVNVGNLLLEDGCVDDAVAHYEAALRIDDAYAAAHLNLGIAFKRSGRKADAVREFRRADRLELRARRARK